MYLFTELETDNRTTFRVLEALGKPNIKIMVASQVLSSFLSSAK